MQNRRIIKGLWLVAAMFVVAAPCAHAAPAMALASAPTPAAGGFTWTYHAYVSSALQSGDFFTIYDIQGYVAGSLAAPANFLILTQLTGISPGQIDVPGDNEAIVNATFQYTGPTMAVAAGSSMDIGAFTFVSTVGGETEGSYAVQTSADQVAGYIGVPGAPGGALAETAGVLSAHAASAPVAQGGGKFLQTFDIDDFTDFGLIAGSYVTIFDATGYVKGSLVAPANWKCTVQVTGITPTDVTISDDNLVENITCKYAGAPLAGGAPASLGEVQFATNGDLSLSDLAYSSNTIGTGAGKRSNEAFGAVAAAVASAP